MRHRAARCACERLLEAELRHVRAQLIGLDARVGRLEIALARGMLLLIANLAGIIVTLLHQLL